METKSSIPEYKPLRMTPLACADSYKWSHWNQYPKDTIYVYSNMTPRSSRRTNKEPFVFFGLQAFLHKLVYRFNEDFFRLDSETAVSEFAQFYQKFFGSVAPDDSITKVTALHDLGYLPLLFRALPEGSIVPHGVPVLTIENTHPNFAWVTNFVESWLSAEFWQPSTSATTSYIYRQTFNRYAALTSDAEWFTAFQGHDFSFRGLEGIEAASASGAGHLLSSCGTDTLPALHWIREHYGHGMGPDYLIGTSVPASEHSVMQTHGAEGEEETYRRLLTECYPSGIVSVVSDTYDFWKIVTETLPALKDVIMARNGKLVIRPDSSPKTPIEIIIGDNEDNPESPSGKGLIECLWDVFGGTVNSKGYKELDSHIGAIYGDSITLDYQEKILSGLMTKGFASTNVVLGIGSYTYQYVTRDTEGLAMKATAVSFGDTADFDIKTITPIFKDPKTDTGYKKSARGLLCVDWVEGAYKLQENCSGSECLRGCLEPVMRNGEMLRHQNFKQVREVLWGAK